MIKPGGNVTRLDRLKSEAAERGMTVSGLFRMVVLEWLKGGKRE